MLNNALENLKNDFELTFKKTPYIICTKNQIQVENFKRVNELSEEKVSVLFNNSKENFIVVGKELKLNLLSKYVLIISGNITAITYPNK